MSRQQTEQLKKMAAEAALQYIPRGSIVGVGTGSTVSHLITALAQIKNQFEGAVASSEATAQQLRAHGIPLYDLNTIDALPLYIDSADEATPQGYLIKGGGGAHTREKILAAVAQKFLCIVDQQKRVDVLGRKAPVPIEVIPLARSYVGRTLVRMGGQPVYREGFKTDNQQIILDVYYPALVDPIRLETELKAITGVVETGLFAKRSADELLIATPQGIQHLICTPGI